MGCGASTSAPIAAPEERSLDQQSGVLPTAKTSVDAELPNVMRDEQVDDTLAEMLEAEREAVSYKPDVETFVGSVLLARAKAKDDPAIMEDACVRLQAHNRRIKDTIARLDAETVHEGLNGGFLLKGVNHAKLITALCTRTKAQLHRTARKFRELYNLDLRTTIKADTSGWLSTGSYAHMMCAALAPADEYVADMIDRACSPTLGCDYKLLVEIFCTRTSAELRAGKAMWEGRTDRSLVDYLSSEMSGMLFGNKSLRTLLLRLLTGERDGNGAIDEAVAVAQAQEVHELCSRSTWFGDDTEAIARLIELISSNSQAQNAGLGNVYERIYDRSLGKDLDKKVNDDVYFAFVALTTPPSRFLAQRLHAALQGWGSDQASLLELLGGLDGTAMHDVHVAYADKYGTPLVSELRTHLSSSAHFLHATLLWVDALSDPSGGLEGHTEADVATMSGNAAALGGMVDDLLVENAALLRAITRLDVERVAEACSGWSVDDTALITALATRSKPFLARMSMVYREGRGVSLERLLHEQITGNLTTGWYAYLAKLLVLPEAQCDARILSLAMDAPLGSDKNALIEFLCARHPRRVRAAKRKWEAGTDSSLVDRLSDELSGDLKTIALTLLKGRRQHDYDNYLEDEDAADEHTAVVKAQQLHGHLQSMPSGKKPTILLLCANSASLNQAIAHAYEDKYDVSLGRALAQGGFDGAALEALKALLQGPYEFYAAKLRAALIDGKDKPVCRILGCHDKWEVRLIARAYESKYNVRLKDELSIRCSGDYKRLAVAWVDLSDHLEQPRHRVALPAHLRPEAPPPVPADDVTDDASGGDGLGVRSPFWRVANAQPLSDQWNIGELEMLLDGRRSTRHDIKRVVCSFNFGSNDLSVVYDGEWYTGGGAEPHSWSGAPTAEGRAVGGSWLGFEFHRPQAISGVTLAQGATDFPGKEGVAEAWLEALVDGCWTKVASLHFDDPNSQALVTAAPKEAMTNEATSKEDITSVPTPAPPTVPTASLAVAPMSVATGAPIARPTLSPAQSLPVATPSLPVATPVAQPAAVPVATPVLPVAQPVMPQMQQYSQAYPSAIPYAQPSPYGVPAPMMMMQQPAMAQQPVVMQPMMAQPVMMAQPGIAVYR